MSTSLTALANALLWTASQCRPSADDTNGLNRVWPDPETGLFLLKDTLEEAGEPTERKAGP